MNIEYPKNDYLKKQSLVRNSLEVAMNGFKDLIKDKIHPKNKSKAYEDRTNPGEGIFSLIVLCLRTNLKLRDLMVEQEHKIKELEIRIKKLNRNG